MNFAVHTFYFVFLVLCKCDLYLNVILTLNKDAI